MSNVAVDFTGVETGGYLPAGIYRARVSGLERKEGQKAPYLLWTFTSAEPDTEGLKSTIMTSLSANALWKLKEVLQAFGVKADSPLRFDTEKFVGRPAMIEVANDPYVGSDGQTRDSHKIARVFGRATEATPQETPKAQAPPVDDRSDISFTNEEAGDDDIPW